jgi:hypothetical protein
MLHSFLRALDSMLQRAILCIFVRAMEERLWPSPLRLCNPPLRLPYHVVAPRLDHYASSLLVEQPSGLQLPLVFSSLWWLSGGSLLPHSFSLPYQPLLHCLPLHSCWLCLDFTGNQNEAPFGIRTKRVWPTDPLLSFLHRLALRPPPPPSPLWVRIAFHHCHRLGLVVWNGLTSTVILWAFLLAQSRIWLLLHNQPRSPQAQSPEHFVPLPPPSIPLPPLAEPPASLEEPPGQLHTCTDCASCSRIHDSVAILHDLVFVVRKDVDDLRFRLENMDRRGERIESLLTTLLISLHSLELATHAPTTSVAILAPGIQVATKSDVEKATTSPHERRHEHMCQLACLVLLIIFVSRRFLLGRIWHLAQSFQFDFPELVYFGHLVFMTGSTESVSLRGDSVHIV